jgi:hydrogenase nickel incorporation protein HypB
MSDQVRLIDIKEEILSDNKNLAKEIKQKLKDKKILLLNLMSSPGSGKTSLILKTIEHLKKDFQINVIEADIDSTVDAEKINAVGVKAIQLKTGGLCHLDGAMIEKALENLDLEKLNLIIIENVGNLVCPAEFDTGAHAKAMILSVPEGDDKPLKYPLMFSVCDVLLVNKIDYLQHQDFDLVAFKETVLKLNPKIKIIETSCKNGQGIEQWANWLKEKMESL